MWMPLALVFLLGAGVVLGGFAGVAYLPGVLASRKLDRRLRDVSTPAGADLDDASVVKQSNRGPLPSIDRAMAKTRIGSRIARLIEQSGTRTTPSGIGVMMLLVAAGSAFAASVLVPLRFAPLASAPRCRSDGWCIAGPSA
jgi:hypothetical protein